MDRVVNRLSIKYVVVGIILALCECFSNKRMVIRRASRVVPPRIQIDRYYYQLGVSLTRQVNLVPGLICYLTMQEVATLAKFTNWLSRFRNGQTINIGM